MSRAVERGLERRQMDQLKHLGMDEKSFKRGHSYITLLTDLDQSRVLEVVEERTCEAADQLWETRTVRKLERCSTTWNAGPCVLNPRDARRQNAGRHGALTG